MQNSPPKHGRLGSRWYCGWLPSAPAPAAVPTATQAAVVKRGLELMTARILRFLGRILCDLGAHDYRLTEKSGGFTAGTEVTRFAVRSYRRARREREAKSHEGKSLCCAV